MKIERNIVQQMPSSSPTFGWVFEATNEGVVLLDPSFQVTYANPRAAQLLRAAPESLVRQSFWDVWPERAESGHCTAYEDAFAGGIPVQFVDCFLDPERENLSVRLYPGAEGIAIFFAQAAGSDFADLSQSELRESETRALKVSESTQRFRLELSDALRKVEDPNEIARVACRMIAQHLNCCRGTYAFVFSKERRLELKTGWQTSVPNIDRSYIFAEVGDDLIAELTRGKSVAIADTNTDPFTNIQEAPSFADLNICSLVASPLVKNGELRAVLSVHDSSVREWTLQEVQLVDEAGRRVWDALERSRSQLEMSRLGDRYRALAETSASVVFAATIEGDLTEIPLIRGLVMTEEDEGLGMGWLSAIHPDDRSSALHDWSTSVANRTSYQTEFRILMQNGRYRWHLARAVLVLDDQGLPREWIGSCIDIHHRVTRERILRLLDSFTASTRDMKSFDEIVAFGQKTLGEALSASRVIYGELRDGGRAFITVPNFCVGCEDLHGKLPISGFSSKISHRLRAGEMIVSEDIRDIADDEEAVELLMNSGMAALVCCPISKNGEVVAILGVHQSHPREWSSDEIEMVQSLAERIWSESGRARWEHELIVSSQRLRTVLEAATVGILVNNREGLLTYANPPLLRMLGYSSEDIQNGEVSWAKIQSADRLEFDDHALRDLLDLGRCEPYETVLIRKDGTGFHAFIGAALIPDQSGAGLQGAAFVTDLTPLKSAEDELRALNSELEKRVDERTAELLYANKEMEGFTYSVSHDLRSPLRSIVATSRILLEDAGDKLSDQDRALLDQQARSAKKLGVLIDDLLKLSRLSRDEVSKTQFDLSALSNQVIQELLTEGGPRKVEIVVQPDMTGYGDVRHIQLVLWNLIDNACKFSPDGGVVRIGQNDGVFFVSDEGIGFDMAYANKLFIPFERLVRDVDFAGTGVGLANVQRIVQRHGGKVWAESSPSNGSTFYFTLPE